MSRGVPRPHRVQALLDAPTYARLLALAEADRRSVSAYLERVVAEHVRACRVHDPFGVPVTAETLSRRTD